MRIAARFLACLAKIRSKVYFHSHGCNPAVRRIMGIETSCDDTGVAIVEDNGCVLGEALHTQLKVHQQTGGIVPHVAGQLHQENLERVTSMALERSGCGFQDITAIAVTTGPGLAPCLNAGLKFAKELAIKENKPLMSVHHMEAHALTPRLQNNVPFPYLVLLISGGHCILATAHSPGRFHRLGQTGDDSPGEAFDKVARWLRLDAHSDVRHLSGGAAIEELAKRGNPARYELPAVMLKSLCCNFSFAGLKTATLRLIQTISEKTGWDGESPLPHCEDVAAAFQDAVCRHLLTRTKRALIYSQLEEIDIKHMVISGGVASNKYIRTQFKTLTSTFGITLHCPPLALCTDNGVMIAWAALEQLKVAEHCTEQIEDKKLMYFGREEINQLDFRPRWPLGDDISGRVKEMEIKNRKLQ